MDKFLLVKSPEKWLHAKICSFSIMYNSILQDKFIHIKGQIISECPLEILDFPKIARKIWQILGQKSVKFFGGFLENLKFQKGHSEINWPLHWKVFFHFKETRRKRRQKLWKKAKLIVWTRIEGTVLFAY